MCGKPCSNESDCISEGQCSVCEIMFGSTTGECKDRAKDGLFADKHISSTTILTRVLFQIKLIRIIACSVCSKPGKRDAVRT